MQSDIDYIKTDKIYKVKKQPWRPHKVRMWLLFPLMLLLALGGYVLFNSVGVEDKGLTDYKVTGDIDYKVYLKDNNYYAEKYLDPGMQYIANLIIAMNSWLAKVSTRTISMRSLRKLKQLTVAIRIRCCMGVLTR